MELLLDCAIRAALFAAAVVGLTRVFRIANASARHKAWCSVMLAMLLLPVFSAWGPKATLRVLPAIAVEEPVILPRAIATPSVASATEMRAADPPAGPKPNFMLIAYLAGAGWMLLRLALGSWRAASLIRRSSVQPGFRVSPECSCPLTLGWLRPIILLPPSWREWPAAELDAVLAHERAHVRRRDPLVQWLAGLNRAIFWFHPLAWWLERRLAALAEEACDMAAIASGHDPRDYSEYLLHQARAVESAGARVAIGGVAMGYGGLSDRIPRLLNGLAELPLPRGRAIAASALCAAAIALFAACRLDRAEQRAPGQPTMNELMHRRVDNGREQAKKWQDQMERARALTPEDARRLAAKLKTSPEDLDSNRLLVQYYQGKADVKSLSALWLWYIEHRPDANPAPGDIDPRWDRAAYERGKALWLEHVKRPGASAEIFRRAGSYLSRNDRPEAERVLTAGLKAYPNEPRLIGALGRLYADSLNEPGAYSEDVRARLANSNDAALLAETAQWLGRGTIVRAFIAITGKMRSGNVELHTENRGNRATSAAQLARSYIDRALAIDPNSTLVRAIADNMSQGERNRRAAELAKASYDPKRLTGRDAMLAAWELMRRAWFHQNFDEAGKRAAELLEIAQRNRTDAEYGIAIYDANIMLGKAALHRGDKKAAVRYLLAAASTPVRDMRNDFFEMNLPRALVDWGERSAVADFLDRMAPKTPRPKQFQDWAADIRRGINPDLTPTFSAPNCSKDPC
jgi:hypothetical protein